MNILSLRYLRSNFERDSKPTVKKRSGGAFLGRSVAETFPKNVNTRFEM
jgi:hypothetical protein